LPSGSRARQAAILSTRNEPIGSSPNEASAGRMLSVRNAIVDGAASYCST